MFTIFGRADRKYNDLYESYKILQNNYDALSRDYNILKAENEKSNKIITELREENAKLREENTALKSVVEGLTASIAQINENMKDLAKKNASLTEIVKKNSSNSSKPPSSDGYMKPAPKSLRTKSGKKVGGQQGHEGHGFEINREPDQLIPHYPDECENCPYHEGGCTGCDNITKTGYVYDIEYRTVLTEHRVIERACPMKDGLTITGEMPEMVNGTLQYGEGLTAFAATLYTRGMVSYSRIAELIDGAFGVPISVGALPIMIQKCVAKVMPALDSIKQALINAPVINEDETGIRVDGRLHWAHVACNAFYTYITVSGRRGCEGIEEAGILPVYSGVSVHDCWGPYFTYVGVIHGICNDHILRELQSVTDNQHQPWAENMAKLLLSMKDERDANAAKGEVCSSEGRIDEISKIYRAIIAQARIQNDSGGINKKGVPMPISKKVAALINRLEKREGEVCLFFKDYKVPRSNNQAERDFRMLKVKTKVSGCFRTYDGSCDFVALMSFLTSAKKHGANAYSAFLAALQGRAMDVVFPADNPLLKTT